MTGRALGFVLVLVLAGACTSHPEASRPGQGATSAVAPVRSARWATPVAVPGLPNFFRVDTGYFRGAQPTADGLRELDKLGVHTVVNLRSLHSDADKIGGLPIRYEQIHFKAWHPEYEDVVRFLKIATAPDKRPVFVHCQHGADRTGMMTAIYRIVVMGWSKDDAVAEMTQGGFGFHPEWQNLVDYVKAVDVDALRHEAGVKAPE